MAMSDVVVPAPDQNMILDTFSEETAENVNNILGMILPNTNLDFTTDSIEPGKGICCSNDGGDFNISYSGSTLILSPGVCIIHNVLIQILETVYMPVEDSDSFLYGNDNWTNGSGRRVYIALWYSPTEAEPEAKVGLFRHNTYYANNSDDLVLFGMFSVRRDAETTYTVTSDPTYIHPSTGYHRDWVVDSTIDGGTVCEPGI